VPHANGFLYPCCFSLEAILSISWFLLEFSNLWVLFVRLCVLNFWFIRGNATQIAGDNIRFRFSLASLSVIWLLFAGVTEAQVKAPAAFVDEGLISQPTPRRTNPTTVIHPKVRKSS